MKSTIEKLNQNRLMELTDEDYQNIVNNTELKTLFLEKIKEGHKFNFEDAYVLEEELLSAEYITIVLDLLKEQYPDEFVSFFFSDSTKIREQFDEKTAEVILKYIEDNMHYALDKIHGVDQHYEKIENKEIIEEILKNKTEHHYGSIYMDPITPEFEELLIDALNRNEYKTIRSVTPKILRKCIETNQLAAAMYGIHPENEEESQIVFDALEQGLISYSELPYSFRDFHKSDKRIIKYQLREEKYIFLDETDFAREEIRKLIIEEVERNHELANEWNIFSGLKEYPSEAVILIKYWNKEHIKNILYSNNSLIENILKEHTEELIDAIIYNLEHNQSIIPEVIEEMFKTSSYYPEIGYTIITHPKFFNYYVSKLPIENILKYLIGFEYNGEREYYIKPEFYELLANSNITINEIPQNFNYKVNYPENIWLAIIPKLDENQLIPSNIRLDKFENNSKIFDCILLRLKELKSNVYNAYLETWQGEITDTLIEIVCSEDNPLNISAAQKLRILPAYKMTNKKYIYEIIENEKNIDIEALRTLLPTLLSLDDIDKIKKTLPILFSKIELSPQAIGFLASQSADVYGTLKNSKDGQININEQYLIFYQCLKEFLRTQKDIPLSLTKYFDEEIAQTATYNNPENLVNNPDLFKINGIAPHHFVEYIKECQNKGLPIDLKLIHQAAHTAVSQTLYDYENITFSNDKETYEILFELLNLQSKDSVKRNIVTKWVNTELDYTFFDCQTELNKKQLMNLIILQDDYIDKILEVISINNIKDSTVLSNSILQLLIPDFLEDPNKKEIVDKIYKTIMDLIKENKVNQFKPDDRLKVYLNYINDPIFINYVTETCVTQINNYMQYIEYFLNDPKYKEATLEALHKSPHLATNNYVTTLIPKYPEIKEYVIEFLEQDTSLWTEFNEKYFDIDLLPAYLKNHSIDKVITFIVHNQDLTLIKPELRSIIKTHLLEQHKEYNPESFAILEQFYGLELYLLLETENLKTLLTKDKDVVQKFAEMFKTRNLDENIITSISDSFRQNYFNIENAHIINFYTNTLEKIQRGITEEEITEVINLLRNYIPDNLEKEIELTGNELLLNTYKVNKIDFISMLIQELINDQNRYASLFNKITCNLIVQKRNEYRSTQDIYKDTNLKYELDTKSLHNALFSYLSKNDPEELYELIENTEYDTDLNLKTIIFLSGKIEKLNKEEIPAIKRNIPNLKAAFIERILYLNQKDSEIKPKKYNYWDPWYEETPPKLFNNLPRRFEYLLENPDFMKQVKKIPIYPDKKKPTEIIGNINISVFEQLTKDEEKYKALLALLNKYRFLEWDNLFDPTVKRLSIGEESINLYNFINAFSKIYDNEKKIILRERKRLMDIVVEEMKLSGKSQEEINDYIRVKENEPLNIQITAYKILKYSTIYSSIANYYKIILGMEDFELVKRNDGPNASYRGAEERLTKATEMQIKMFELDKITVPSFIYEHEFEEKEKKKLAVTVGNRADSRNLTHGERTGACMRAYGHADSLFEFCNTDPRGFHITFTDPETNEYISRVSCFRNGNTVFLNQLRESVNKNYTTKDVIEACYAVAQELIERSKDSDMPIENVVASTGYALMYYETQTICPYNNIGDGVYTGYRDVNNSAVVLATTGENGKAVPFVPNGENQPVYEPVRLKPREYISPNITESTKIQLQRITSIKECLENKESIDHYKTIDFDYELISTEYLHVIIGQDWYVALDINGNLTHDIAVQNEHSIEELNEALAKMSKIKEEKIKIGGFTNGIQ